MPNPSDQYEIKSILFNSQDRSQGTIENPLFILPETEDIDAIKVKNALIGFSVYPIDSRNNKVYFRELRDTGTTLGSYTATITPGYYTGSTLATELDTRLSAAGLNNYSTAYDSITNTISISTGNALHGIQFSSGNNSINYELGINNGSTFASTLVTNQIDVSGVKCVNIISNIGATNIFGSNKKILASVPTVAENLAVDLYADDSEDYVNIRQKISEIEFRLADERMREIKNLTNDWSIQLLLLQKN